MAKIDLTKIEGYAEMSAEDKLKALEGYEIPDADYSGYVTKEQFDKTASELAAKKKELKDKLSEDEKAKLEAQEQQEAMKKELEGLRRESTISKNKARYLALGYDEKLAENTAAAVADGDLDTVFKNEKAHLDAFEKSIKAEALKGTPRPSGAGADPGEMTLEKYRKMSGIEQDKYYRAHTEEVKALYENEVHE